MRLGPLGVGDCPERAKAAGDVDYDWVVGLVQQRQRGLGDADEADDVGVEHRERGRPGDPVGVYGAVPDADVVDQDIDAPVEGVDRSHGGLRKRRW